MRNARTQTVVKQIENDAETHDELHPRDVERYDVYGEQYAEQGDAYGICQNDVGLAAVVQIDAKHASREYLNHQQDGELTHRRWRIEEVDTLILDAHDEINHHRHSREEDASRHSLTIKHEEKVR